MITSWSLSYLVVVDILSSTPTWEFWNEVSGNEGIGFLTLFIEVDALEASPFEKVFEAPF